MIACRRNSNYNFGDVCHGPGATAHKALGGHMRGMADSGSPMGDATAGQTPSGGGPKGNNIMSALCVMRSAAVAHFVAWQHASGS